MSINAGELRTPMTIVRKTRAPNGQGGSAITWADGQTIRAKLEVIRSTEAIIANVQRTVTLYRATVRFRANLQVEDRLRWSGGLLDIKSCGDPDGSRAALVITAETIAG